MSDTSRLRMACTLAIVAVSLLPGSAAARPSAPAAFCEAFPDAPACEGAVPTCATCHTTPPALNVFGRQVAEALGSQSGTWDDATFATGVEKALTEISALDADEDGADNGTEIAAGTVPADASSHPVAAMCLDDADRSAWSYDTCAYDPRYVLRKVQLDVCGTLPTRDAFDSIAESDDPRAKIHDVLDDCLQTPNWRGNDGVVWNMANTRILPDAATKAGENAGDIPLGDYEDDYNLFVYTQIDGRDARELLTADYFVARDDALTAYTPYERTIFEDFELRGADAAQFVGKSRRAGMLTTRWFLVNFVMFTAVPRTAAAQAYRSYLGYDIAKMEGLSDVASEPADYDAKGVAEPACATCHATLDPLTYPFSRYDGLGGGDRLDEDVIPGSYNPYRLDFFVASDGPRVLDMPERGVLLGQDVADLREWGEVAANSDEFARAMVQGYWEYFLGEPPRPDEAGEFETLWRRFSRQHGYSVDAMLHDLVMTEAYGVP
ncbi:MAG: hypothetical protein ACRBN8_23300 [Nannocystales bacterium]